MSGQGVQTRTVEEKDNGIRLDKWFLHYFPNLKFSHLQKLMRSGQIRANSKRVKGSTRIATGDKIRIPPLDKEAANPVKQNTVAKGYKLTNEDRQLLQDILLYEDDDIIAVNKPYGLAVQGGSKQTRHLDGILSAFAAESGQERPHLVHRLDKDTSGVFVVAKNIHAARQLGQMFRDHQIQKFYWAACLGVPEHNEGEITAPLSKQRAHYGEYMFVDPDDGKPSQTDFRVVERLGRMVSWIVFSPLTGRTHQIRAHATFMDCPILGDDKYGGLEDQQRFEEVTQDKNPALHLHAQQLIIPALSSSKNKNAVIDISAPLPEHMFKTWQKFGLSETHIANNRDLFTDDY